MRKLILPLVLILLYACQKEDYVVEDIKQDTVELELEEVDYIPSSGVVSVENEDNTASKYTLIQNKYKVARKLAHPGSRMYDLAKFIWGDHYDPTWMIQRHPDYDDPHHFDVYIETFIRDLKAWGLYDHCIEANMNALRRPDGTWNVVFDDLSGDTHGQARGTNGDACDDGWTRSRIAATQIAIDSDWWKRRRKTSFDWGSFEIESSGIASGHGDRWTLMYHELGHAVLRWKGRNHRSHASSKKGQPSIMRPSIPTDDPARFFLLKSLLFKYYMEERIMTHKTPYLQQQSVWWQYSNHNRTPIFRELVSGSISEIESDIVRIQGNERNINFTAKVVTRGNIKPVRYEWYVYLRGKWYQYGSSFHSDETNPTLSYSVYRKANGRDILLYN